MLRFARAVCIPLLATVAFAGEPPATWSDPVTPCPTGWTKESVQHVDAFGTPNGSCAMCTADPQDPGGRSCFYAEWDTQLPAPTTVPLVVRKYTPQDGLSQLTQVDLVVRGNLCGIIRIEYRDPSHPCVQNQTLRVQLSLSPLPGQGLDFLGALIPSPLFDLQQSSTYPLGPFDGVVDFMGPSGHTEVYPELVQEHCVRITDPAQLAAFVDDGVGSDTLLFHHSALDSSSSPDDCIPHALKFDPFAGIELEVRYRYCTAPDLTSCFGTDATCPCANGGAADTGCDNAQATGGVRLTASGDVGLNTVVLHGTGFPASSSPAVIVIRSTGLEGTPVLFGDGLRCISLTNLVRFGAAQAAGGLSVHTVSHGAGPGSFHYQLWYRNNPATFCDPSAAFNASNALSIEWP